ncbi:MAG: TIGR02099 family protein [Betaproteobacteria bacterium]|nr:TIGR02099 family protein [Betaproteobacteria bacterium]
MNAKSTEFSFLSEPPAQKRSPWPSILQRFVQQRAVFRRLARILGWLSLAGGLLCGLLYVVMRVWLFPWLGENREWVAAKLTSAAGAPVSIERLDADWLGLRPHLRLGGLTIHAGERETLRLERVEATLSWTSLPRWMPYFHMLEITGPEIELGRATDGVLTVAGIRMEPDARKRNNPIAWLFDQSRIVVRDAALVWNDALRDAPPLRLTDVQFTFVRGVFSHSLELQARPPVELAKEFKVTGDVRRYDSATLDGIDGRLSIGLEQADLGGWSAWVDYPVPCKGNGNVHLWLDSNGKGAAGLSASLDLKGVEATLASGLTPLRFDRFNGRILARQAPGRVEFEARDLWLKSSEINRSTPVNFRFELRKTADGTLNGGALSAPSLDLTMLMQLSESLPLGENEKALLAEFNPSGRLQQFSFEWEGESGALQGWKIDAVFEGIGLTARGLIPGMGNMSGWIKGNSQQGEYVFSSQDGYVDLPRVFEEARIPVASLNAKGDWNHPKGEQLVVTLGRIDVSNGDVQKAWAAGSYRPAESGPGVLDISGQLTGARGAAVWRYIPIIAGERVRDWLKDSIVHADVVGAKVELHGPLPHFPFRNGEGEFSVIVQSKDGRLDYVKGWPALDHFNGELHFKGPGLLINSHGGDVLGVRVEPLRVEIPDLKNAIMTIEGTANGPSADFLRFIAESPLSERLHGFTEPLRPEGSGRLDLKLVMPLQDVSRTEVEGEYRFNGNRVRLSGVANGPALEAAEGSLSFSQDALKTLAIRGRLLGGECAINGKMSESGHGVDLSVRGQVEAGAVREAFDWPLLGWISGNTPWSAEMSFGQGSGKVVVRSGLKGVYSRLPMPFAKETDETWPLEVVAVSPGRDKPLQITAKLGDRLNAVLERDVSGAVRGGVGLYRPTPMSSNNGVQVAATLDMLDIDAWQWSLSAGAGEGQGDGNGDDAALWTSVMLDARQVRAFGYIFNAMQLRAANNAESWTAHLNSTEAQGVISWKRGGDGILSARLGRLALSGDGADDDDQGKNDSLSSPPPRGLPGLDVRAEEFAIGEREMGQLEVRATNQEGAWRLDNFSIRHSDGQFSGSGHWQPGAQHSTLDFTLNVTNVGRLATAMGYGNIVQGGHAKLAGKLEWNSSPTRIDYPTLSGQIELSAKGGRFERIQPGVGRLLGVLSLQALPRRVTLDFRDVFSDGFVFDRIEGKATVSEGVMRSDDIAIVGPAAQVQMRGETDIAAETQDLQVRVQPTLSESVALGAAIVNPVAGVVTYLVQRSLGDPIEKLFAYDYTITGKWEDPVVEKVGASPLTPAPESDDGGKPGISRSDQ